MQVFLLILVPIFGSMNDKLDKDPRNQELSPKDIPRVEISIGPASLTQWGNLAERWMRDAHAEARSAPANDSEKRNALRREVVFAVCAAESYLFEWVRDREGHYAYGFTQKVKKALTERGKLREKGVIDRWKLVVTEVLDGGKPSKPSRFDRNSTWNDFVELVKHRDFLVHGGAALPRPPERSELTAKYTPRTDPFQQSPGYAVDRVVALIRQVHSWAGTAPPKWL